MKQKPLTSLNVSLLLAAMTCPAGEILASEAPDITITIHVYNYAAVSEKTLARAKEEAGWIFGNAGLTALWVEHALSAADLRHPHHPLIPGTGLTMFYGCSHGHQKRQARMRWESLYPSTLPMFL